MERASTFFGNLGETLQNIARWIIKFGRRYQIAPAAYLVAFSVCLINYANQPVTPPPPPAPSAQYPVPTTATAPVPAIPQPTAVTVAEAKAYKSGDSITIRWNQPVSQQQLMADGSLITAKCEPEICTATLTQQAYEVRASWYQGSEYFNTKFKL